ncbi:uncharacterized protein LOC117317565 [Pecten maximus]|uniref:uncharacterized protein LOC117317565 n=1 Tax=Pecten maximus TaxID=6579 RepID=UPI00145886E6|nr:uncharacterized protein LOC117317565 [Pecten maximus]
MTFRDVILSMLVAVLAAGLVLVERKLTDAIDAYRSNTETNVLSVSVNKALTEAMLEQNEARKSDLSQLSKLKSEIEELKDMKLLLEEKILKAEVATTYVRWGRNDCSGSATDLVYSGYVGGSHFTHKGAAVDYVCLPSDPSWGRHANRPPGSAAFMYGAEYEDTIIYNVPDKNREVPCAVCRAKTRSSLIMIPARTTCYTGWEKAYLGYLSAGYHDHHAATQYVCVDEDPQTVVGGGNNNDNGNTLLSCANKMWLFKMPPLRK